jgi:hypothetical protein
MNSQAHSAPHVAHAFRADFVKSVPMQAGGVK